MRISAKKGRRNIHIDGIFTQSQVYHIRDLLENDEYHSISEDSTIASGIIPVDKSIVRWNALKHHYYSIIMEQADKFIEKSLKSYNLKVMAREMASLNAEYVINHRESDNESTLKNIHEIFQYGFKKSTMGLLLSFEHKIVITEE